MAAFRQALAEARAPFQTGQQELFPEEDEAFIQHEVERLLYEPKLPNAGNRERRWIKKLREFARDDALVVTVAMLLKETLKAFEDMLPRQEFVRRGKEYLTLPGCYYTRRKLTPKTAKERYKALLELRREAIDDQDWPLKWLADFLMEGVPEPVSNFKLECLYLLRGSDGNVTRLVRLVNVLGEVSEGREFGGTDVLPSDAFASAEKFRAWCLSKGNFNWGVGGGAGNIELQMLHADTSSKAAYKVAKFVEYVGWHELKGHGEPLKPGEVSLRPGLWFFDECAIADGKILRPDEDGIFIYDGVRYALARKGRETEFTHGRPQMHPDVDIRDIEFDTTGWELPPAPAADGKIPREAKLTGFFREVCRRFYDTAGGYEGWMTVGALLAYAAAPEIFHERKLFPSLWAHGQMGSGKTLYSSWAMSFAGFRVNSGLGLISRNVTPVGIMCQLENYSNLPVWLDEFRQAEVGQEKLAILRDVYNRQLAAKWSPDGQQRVIRTTPLVSGESTTSDAAVRSRYPHVQLSEGKRLSNHLEWFQAHHDYFFLFFREVVLRREEFVRLLFTQLEAWMNHPELASVGTRDRVTHAVGYAAFVAATVLFESHGAEETTSFRRFLTAHARSAAADVQAEVNVNVFIQDLVTAYNANAVPNDVFRVEMEEHEHPPGAVNQGRWTSMTLFIEPAGAIAYVQSWLTKQRMSVTLRQKDLRDQLSKHPFWVGGKIRKRFGPAGKTSVAPAWGILLDHHPLGYQAVSDAEFESALTGQRTLAELGPGMVPVFQDGDPRRGPLYAIVDGVTAQREGRT